MPCGRLARRGRRLRGRRSTVASHSRCGSRRRRASTPVLAAPEDWRRALVGPPGRKGLPRLSETCLGPLTPSLCTVRAVIRRRPRASWPRDRQ
eukprot:3674667-Prymnesium_polylepis.2